MNLLILEVHLLNMSESDVEYLFYYHLITFNFTYRREGAEQVVVPVEEEKTDNIHDAIKVVIKKSLAHNGKL